LLSLLNGGVGGGGGRLAAVVVVVSVVVIVVCRCCRRRCPCHWLFFAGRGILKSLLLRVLIDVDDLSTVCWHNLSLIEKSLPT
jgi:hypothetical protein